MINIPGLTTNLLSQYIALHLYSSEIICGNLKYPPCRPVAPSQPYYI